MKSRPARSPTTLLPAVLAGLALAACGGSSDATPAPATDAVTIQFKAKVGAADFSCGSAGYALGTGALPWKPKDLRFYVHDVRLVTAAGVEAPVTLADEVLWQRSGVALLDFENNTGTCNVGTAETNTSVRGTVARGTYTGLRFRVGVPETQNHLNVQTALPPLQNSALWWSWTGGYKFMKVDGAVAAGAGGADIVRNFHLGSTGCSGTAPNFTCATPNRPEVAFAAFNPATQSVVLDLESLFGGSNHDVEGGVSPGCMSAASPVADPECPPIFAVLGLDWAPTTTPAVPQTAFKVQ